jgi:hypothetical protein
MRRSTEKMIAVQILTVIVAVTGLLLAQLLAGTRRAQAPTYLLSRHGIAVSSASPWHSLKRLIHRKFWAGSNEPDVTVALAPPTTTAVNSRGQ